MKIVIVYLGQKAPKHVWKNLAHLRKTFTAIDTVLVSDQLNNIQKAKKMGIQSWTCSDVSSKWNNIQNQMSHDIKFRNGFWFYTAARFEALNEYLSANSSHSILQVEGDVWLSPNFPMQQIATIEQNYAFPLDNSREGVASTLFIRSAQSGRELANFAFRKLQENPEATDMTILGDLAAEKPSACLILPSAFEINSDINQDLKVAVRITENINRFDGLFDGMHWGLYMLGEDPRNHRGIRYVYKSREQSAVQPWKLNPIVLKTGLPGVQIGNQEIPIYSLHIHCKDIRCFDTKKMMKIWKKRVVGLQEDVRKELVLKVFVLQTIKYLQKRLRPSFYLN